MGGAASAQLNAEEISLVTKSLKAKYEDLSKEGKPDEEIQQLLTAEYIRVVSSVSAAEETTTSSDAPEKKSEKGKGGSAKDAPHSKVAPKGRISPAPGRPGSRENDGNRSRRSSFGKENNSGKDNDGNHSRRSSFGNDESKGSQKGSGKVGLGRGSGKRGNGGSNKMVGAPRRRSFDDRRPVPTKAAKPMQGNGIADEEQKPPAAAATETTEGGTETKQEEPPQLDSWDSVSTQPYCKVCKMAFKSVPFLERHVKYSDVHARNVKIAEEAAAGPPPQLATLPVTDSGKLAPKQVEGQHYKLMYSGSKLFWRTQEQVDLNFYHHILPHVIEVIGYDTVKCKEMNRIYIDYTRLHDNVDAYHKAYGLHDDEVEKEPHEVFSRFILQRLQLQPASSAPTPPVASSVVCSRLVFVKLSSDGSDVSPLLDKPPVVLVPVSVTRRRRTNAEEISAAMENLASDRAALVEATGKAQKVANLVYTSATSIAKKKWWADFNPVRRKWIWAIRRVIRQKHVAETKENLKARELAKTKGSRRHQLQESIKKTNSREI